MKKVSISAIVAIASIVLIAIACGILLYKWTHEFTILEEWLHIYSAAPYEPDGITLFWTAYFIYEKVKLILAYVMVLTALNILALIAILVRTAEK